MSIGRSVARRRLLLAVMSLPALACHAGLRGDAGGAAATTSAAAAPEFAVTQRAEPGAITALAFRSPTLFAGNAQGLRRWDVGSDEYEWIGFEAGLLGQTVTAIGVDGEHNAWVATDVGVGRIVRGPKDDGWHYVAMGNLANITSLAPMTQGRGVGAWAGGPDGLFRSDGTSWAPIEVLHGVAVTSLDLDPDGHSVWVGTRAQGLFRADGEQARAVLRGDALTALDEVVGTAVTAVGTRVVAARAGQGTRLIFLEEGEPQAFRAQPDVRVVRLVDTGKDAVLVAGPVGVERAYTLQPLRKGDAPPPGGLRFVSVKKGTAGARGSDRWAAVPSDGVPPPGVTVVSGGEGAVYYGTARMGVARGAAPRPAYLSGAQLVGDAERLYVACASAVHCFVVTEGPRAWLTDGDVYRVTHVGETDDATVLAVVTDGAGTIYALSGEPKFTGLVITRLAGAAPAGAGPAAGSDAWKPFQRVPLVMPTGGPPGISLAAVSPGGALWVGLRAHSPGGDGDDVSAGAVEIDLQTHHVVQHRLLKEGEHPTPEMLPLPPGLTGVLFDPPALWLSSLSGVSRWQQGELRTWGENEGLQSELCHGVAKAADGSLWAATSEGVARFDGKAWRAMALADGEDGPVATRALVRDGQNRMWVATAKGLRVAAPAPSQAPRSAPVVVAGNMRDVHLDRYGRVWALSASSIALVDLGRK
jgi:hypothetical protein